MNRGADMSINIHNANTNTTSGYSQRDLTAMIAGKGKRKQLKL